MKFSITHQVRLYSLGLAATIVSLVTMSDGSTAESAYGPKIVNQQKLEFSAKKRHPFNTQLARLPIDLRDPDLKVNNISRSKFIQKLSLLNRPQFVARAITPNTSDTDPAILVRKDRYLGPTEQKVFTVFFGNKDGTLPTSPAEQIDCSRLPQKSSGVNLANVFRIETERNVTGGKSRTQLMYADSEHPLSSNANFRGELQCDESNNSLSFTIPGRLLGGSEVKVHAIAYSKTGLKARRTFTFRVENPDVVIRLTKVRNNSGKKWDVRNPIKPSKKRADIYVITQAKVNTGVTIIDREREPVTSSLPQLGVWKNVPKDAERRPNETRIYNGEVGLGLDLGISAFDHDNYDLALINAKLWQASSATYCRIEQYCPDSLPEFTAPLHKRIQDKIEKSSKDDFMAGTDIKLRHDSDPEGSSLIGRNWGLDPMFGQTLSRDGYEINMGNVTIWLRIYEAQPSWTNPEDLI